MNIKNEIKAYIVREGFTMSELVEKLTEQYGWSPSIPNLSDKLRRESLRYKEAVELADVRNMSGFIRKMCIDGYTVQLQIPELTECAKLLRYTSNNVNQIARRVNFGDGVYPDEMDKITAKLVETSGLFGNILEQLSKIT